MPLARREPARRDASHRIFAADWFSSAPKGTSHFRAEVLTSCHRSAFQSPSRWVADLFPANANPSPFHRFRRGRPRMAARLVPRRPTVVETSTSMVARCPEPAPGQRIRLPLDRMPRLQTLSCRCRAASGIPVRPLQPRTVPNPVTPRTGTLRTEAPYHRQVPARHDEARALPRLA